MSKAKSRRAHPKGFFRRWLRTPVILMASAFLLVVLVAGVAATELSRQGYATGLERVFGVAPGEDHPEPTYAYEPEVKAASRSNIATSTPKQKNADRKAGHSKQ